MIKKIFFLLTMLALSVSASAVNPDFQETENGVTSNKIIVVGCKAAVGRVYNNSNGSTYDRGFCWSTSQNPTVSDSHTNTYWADDGNSGTTPSGTSIISSNAGTIYIMEGLQPSTRYYIRPYIKSSRNGSYIYGKEYVIWTLPAADWEIYQNWDENNPSEYNINTVKKHNGENANVTEVLTWLTSCRQEAQDLFNKWTSFYKRITYNFSDWEDGAHCSYGGDPSFGPGFTQNTGTLMHETGHNLGVGTEWRYQSWDSPLHPTYLWTGERANRVFTLFEDKPDEPRNPDGSFPSGGNHTISDGDRVHVCYGLTGNINYIYRVRQAAYYEGMYQDGLSATGGDAGPYYSFETAAYMNGSTETDLTTKYYITNEDIATCNRYLCEENGKLTYKKITSRSAMLNNNAFAWYVIYNPSNAFFYIKNVSTGHYFSYSGSDFTMQSSRNEPIKLMPSRNNSTVNGQTLKAYWMTRGILDWEPASLSASRINLESASSAGFNLYDDAGYERWFILSADQVNAVGDVVDPTPNQGLEQLTVLPTSSDYYKYFFVLTDHTRDLTMVSQDADKNGNENDMSGNHRRAAWYRSRVDLTNAKNALWTLNYNNQWDNIESQIFTNADYPHVQMQTEWGNASLFRSSDNNRWWDRTQMEYLPDGYWTIHNVPNGTNNCLGPWNDGNFSDWQEMAFNKTNNDQIGHFNVYSILRGEYVKYYQNYSSATPGNPLNITYVLENPGAERKHNDTDNSIGWMRDGNDWSNSDNDALVGKVGRRYFDISVSGSTSTLYQDIHGLPAGYYRFSALATGNGKDNNLALIANGHTIEQTIVPAANDGTRSVVIVQLTDGETLRVGLKALGNDGEWVKADDCRLEYIGTDVPSYRVDDPVLTFENGSTVDDIKSFTYDFIDAVTTDNSVTFTLLNSNAKVTIKKNGTIVKEGSVSLNGTKLTADFSGFTPERGTTYTLTLPAGVVGFAGNLSNVERTITFTTSTIKAGYYYLRNNDSSWNTYYLSRGGGGTQAYMDNFGLAVHIDTNKDGGTTIQYFDSRLWLYGDGWTYTDQGDINNALKFTVEPQGNNIYKFKTQGRTDNGYLAIWDGKAVCDGRPGDNLLGNTNQWTLESIADHRVSTRNKDAQAAALGLASVSTWAQLESQMTSNYSGEVVYTDIVEIQDHWQWGAHNAYEHQLTGLTNGIYRITVFALQRATQWDWMWAIDNTYGVNDVRYLYGNDQKTLIMSNTEDGASYNNTDGMYQYNGLYYPNNTSSAERAFSAGKYKNTLYVKVTNGTLNVGIVDPCGIPANNQWLCYKNLKVERMVSGLVGLEADGITDGGYISEPITSVTIKPLNTALTSVTIANNTKVTIYKDGTQVSQVTPSKSGANLIVNLPTLENGATYKLTLDEKKLTFNNNSKNAAFEVTFKTPYIYDGTYYLYNPLTDDFIGRTGDDGDIKTTFLGTRMKWTNGTNGGTLMFDDNLANPYIGGQWWTNAQSEANNLSTWETIVVGDGLYRLRRENGRNEYLYVSSQSQRLGSNGHHVDDGPDNDINFNNEWERAEWQFMTEAEYNAYVRTLNETDVTAPASSNGNAVKVVFNRSIVGNAWNTICFPFTMTSEQIKGTFGKKTIVKELDEVEMSGENAVLKFNEVSDIEPNTPYILQTDQSKDYFQLRGMTLVPEENLTKTVGGIKFIGNYIYNENERIIPAGDYYLLNDQFKKSKNGTKLKGYRAWFHLTSESGIKSLGFDNGNATGIEVIDAMNITFPADIYNVGGQLVRRKATDLKDLPQGIYFVNGRKILKR